MPFQLASILALVLSAAAVTPVAANTINYTVAGLYGPTTPTTTLTAPNTAFTLSFSQTVPTNAFLNSVCFNPLGLAPAVYSSQGVTQTFQLDRLFCDAAAGGGFDLAWATGNGLSLLAAPLFSGTTLNPTLLEGVFPIFIPGSVAVINNAGFPLTAGSITASAPVPEPATLLLFGSGAALLLRRRRG